MAKQKPLGQIRSKLLTRGMSLAKTGIRMGALMASQAARMRKNPDRALESYSSFFMEQMETLAHELGELKGSVMKVGQLLSTYGEHLLPAEVNQVLKRLQYQSPPMEWKAIETQLLEELGRERMKELDIDPRPWAAASIGQVHRAQVRTTNEAVALKIQYPGVAEAIDTDLKFFRGILSLSPILPKGPKFDNLFIEVREMLYREVDYRQELESTNRFRDRLMGDPRYRVPKIFTEFSSQRVLCSEFINAPTLDSPEIAQLSQSRRNFIGRSYLDLYLRELIEFREMQTDPHFGNYRIEINPSGLDRLVLLDFGAVRKVPDKFLRSYLKVVRGSLEGDLKSIESGGRELGLLLPDDPQSLIDAYNSICLLITEPFQSGDPYNWGQSDLPRRVAREGAKLALGHSLREPPKESIFLDRKLGGTFVILAKLGVVESLREVVIEKLNRARGV